MITPVFEISTIEEIEEVHKNSISVKEMRDSLSNLNPDAKLFILQKGPYSNGCAADIFIPKLANTIADVTYYAIGCSDQSI